MERRNKCVIFCSLLWVVLLRSFDPSTLFSFHYWGQDERQIYQNILNSVTIIFYIILPIFALLADIKFGRLNTTIIVIFIGAVCSICYTVLSFLIGTAIDTVTSVIVPLVLFTRVYLEVLILCFVADQLIELSCKSGHFSTYVWWRAWCSNLGTMITEVSTCLFNDHKYYESYASIIHFVLLIIMLVTALLIKKWTIRYYYSVNPIKLIFGVLKFAHKNKYPLNRSALTYWEEVEPSRINLGKSKYGGPFLEKDVESVKTFLRLIPLVAVVIMIFFPYQTLRRLSAEKLSNIKCLLFETYFIEYVLVTIAIPIYQFIIKPYCLSHVRMSMLRKMGIGIALTVLGKLAFIILDLSISVPAYVNYNDTICFLQSAMNSTNNHDLIINESYSYYFAIPCCINSFGVILSIAGSLEFVFAQAPHSMRGLLLGLWFSIGGIYEIAGWMMIKPFKAVSEYLVPSCELYILIMNFLFMLVSFILFIVLSRCYKLHGHEDVFNAHHVAEMYYENEFNRRDQSNTYGSIVAEPQLEK